MIRLYYFRARMYSAQLGRFISRDPFGYVDGMSLYRAYFVPEGIDPSGHRLEFRQPGWKQRPCNEQDDQKCLDDCKKTKCTIPGSFGTGKERWNVGKCTKVVELIQMRGAPVSRPVVMARVIDW